MHGPRADGRRCAGQAASINVTGNPNESSARVADLAASEPRRAGGAWARFVRRLQMRVQLRSRLYWRSRWANGNYVSDTPAIIVGGCIRSGTTLLRTMLDSHPNVAAGPETWLFVGRHADGFPWLADEYGLSREYVREMAASSPSLPEFIERFLGEYAERMGKGRWAEKSPGNVMRLGYIFRHYPRAKFIHVIRDGRDVVCSIVSQRERLRKQGIDTPVDGTTADRIRFWLRAVHAGLAWRGDPRYLEVSYESLVHNPEAEARRVLDFIGEPWCDDVLNANEVQKTRTQRINEYGTPEVHKPIFKGSIGRWQSDLSPADIAVCHRIGGKLLAQLGYSVPSNGSS